MNPPERRKSGLFDRIAAPEWAAIAFALFVIAGIWVVAYLSTRQAREQLAESAQSEILGAQSLIASQIGRTIDAAGALLVGVDLWLAEQFDSTIVADLDLVADRIRRSQKSAIDIDLYDLAGEEIVRGSGSRRVLDPAERRSLMALAESPLDQFSVGVEIAARGKTRRISVVKRANINVFGAAYIVASIPPEQLDRHFDRMLVTAPGTVGAIRGDGLIVYRYPDPENFTGQRFDLDVLLGPRDRRADSGLLKNIRSPDGTILTAAYQRIDDLPIYSYARFREADIDEMGSAHGRPVLAFAGLATLLTLAMAGVVIWFERSRAREADRLRRALIDAQAANVAKREFLANISHELRTPLNAIIGFSDLMAAQPFGALNDRYRGYADDIQGAGRHLLSIVNQLLDLAAIEAGRLRLQPETLDPGDVIREVAEMMRAIARERNVRVVEVPPGEAFTTIGDRTMLRQIVTNLAGNAVRHCRVNGAVRLAWSQDGAGQYTIAIEDEGLGIPAEDIAHIFEPFWRKESSSLTRRGGTGLGLMITRQFVTRWGGAIAVDSEIGKGSVFTVTLPLRIDALGGR
ncbi:MAG: hypothetical protein J0H39_21830 [Alphaproteobacteria bacterium]|nr:hypothetical protein [Alphaproteobacteria bacterium]